MSQVKCFRKWWQNWRRRSSTRTSSLPRLRPATSVSIIPDMANTTYREIKDSLTQPYLTAPSEAACSIIPMRPREGTVAQ